MPFYDRLPCKQVRKTFALFRVATKPRELACVPSDSGEVKEYLVKLSQYPAKPATQSGEVRPMQLVYVDPLGPTWMLPSST